VKRGIEKMKHCSSRKGVRAEPTAVQCDPDRGGRSVIVCRQTRVSNAIGILGSDDLRARHRFKLKNVKLLYLVLESKPASTLTIGILGLPTRDQARPELGLQTKIRKYAQPIAVDLQR
jgi:hypothetical protein